MIYMFFFRNFIYLLITNFLLFKSVLDDKMRSRSSYLLNKLHNSIAQN